MIIFWSTAALGDAYSVNLEMPPGIDVSTKRTELLDELPRLTSTGSRTAITAYRQNLNLFNEIKIQGLYAEIREICEILNEKERAANKEWDKGNISRNEHQKVLEQIAAEREKCSDRYARTSPYFGLYYELISLYQRLDADSVAILSECNTKDACRNN